MVPTSRARSRFMCGRFRTKAASGRFRMAAAYTVKDLAPDGKRIVALMPAAESKGAQAAQNHVVFLENFFDELRCNVPIGE